MTITVGATLKGLARCPHCSIAAPHLAFRSSYYDGASNAYMEIVWCTYECMSCHAPVVAGTVLERDLLADGNKFATRLHNEPPEAGRVFPEAAAIDDDLPERPKKYLEQAVQSLHSPDGAVMLAGSAIDAMLKLKGYGEGSVYSRIEQAVIDHVLTQNMSDWAHAVRLESNKPRHADLDEPHATFEMAKLTIQFARALGDFLFVFPARVARGKAASEKELRDG